MDGHEKLLQYCSAVLQQNHIKGWTKPTTRLYPHQWLWDSCFVAIGSRHVDVKSAQKEIKSLFRGQWKNGMIPNIIYGDEKYYQDDIWNSKVSKNAPRKIATSGITQPPMIAEAVIKIGEKLNKIERIQWYKEVFDGLLKYHEWIYRERDPHGEGLAVLIHPWECGLDNTPSWISEMHMSDMPLWIKTVRTLKLHSLFNALRGNTKYLPAYERIDVIDALGFYRIVRRLRRKRYETRLILRHSNLSIEDLAFNAILIRANTLLLQIAKECDQEIPGWLLERIKKAPHALELLWSEQHQQYFSRNFSTFEPITEPSIMTFLPLYAGTISRKRAAQLVELMKSKHWTTKYPVPSVPKNSKYFQPVRYWQGPTWINTNWLIAEGLERYGYLREAAHIKHRSLELLETSGSYEYFSPLDGRPAGAPAFSWSAALAIDFLYSKNR
jgi:hypothetical protein